MVKEWLPFNQFYPKNIWRKNCLISLLWTEVVRASFGTKRSKQSVNIINKWPPNIYLTCESVSNQIYASMSDSQGWKTVTNDRISEKMCDKNFDVLTLEFYFSIRNWWWRSFFFLTSSHGTLLSCTKKRKALLNLKGPLTKNIWAFQVYKWRFHFLDVT